MEPIPLPSQVHYELILQLLERKSLAATHDTPMVKDQMEQLIRTLRKALAQQKQLELKVNPRTLESPNARNFCQSLTLTRIRHCITHLCKKISLEYIKKDF